MGSCSAPSWCPRSCQQAGALSAGPPSSPQPQGRPSSQATRTAAVHKESTAGQPWALCSQLTPMCPARPSGPLESTFLGPPASPRNSCRLVTSPWGPTSSPDPPLKVVLPDRAPQQPHGVPPCTVGTRRHIVQAHLGSPCHGGTAAQPVPAPLLSCLSLTAPAKGPLGVLPPGHPGTPGSPLSRASLSGF